MGRHALGHRPLGYIVLLNNKGEPDMKYKVAEKGKVICINGPEMRPCPGYDITNATRCWRKDLKARSLPPPPLPAEIPLTTNTLIPQQSQPHTTDDLLTYQAPKYPIQTSLQPAIPPYPMQLIQPFQPVTIAQPNFQQPTLKPAVSCQQPEEEDRDFDIFTMQTPMEITDFLNLMQRSHPIIATRT